MWLTSTISWASEMNNLELNAASISNQQHHVLAGGTFKWSESKCYGALPTVGAWATSNNVPPSAIHINFTEHFANVTMSSQLSYKSLLITFHLVSIFFLLIPTLISILRRTFWILSVKFNVDCKTPIISTQVYSLQNSH